MSLTNGADLYAALNETGLQKFLHSVFLARPHYFHYATAGLGGGSTDISLMPPLPVPGNPTGIDFSLALTEPEVEFYPVPSWFFAKPDPPGTPLTVGPNQFALHTQASISVPVQSQSLFLLMKGLRNSGSVPPPPINATLDIYAVGQPTVQTSGQGAFVSLSVVEIQINGAGSLDLILGYLGQQMLNGLLTNLSIPVSSMGLGAFTLKLQSPPPANPQISGNQLQVWAGII